MPAVRWGRRVRDAFTEQLGYKAGAFVLAVAMWVAASGEEPASRYMIVRFTPVLDSGARLLAPPPAVHALVEGPTRELIKLYTTPPSIHRVLGDVADSTRVDLRPNDVVLPDGVTSVSVGDVQPHTFTLHVTNAMKATAAIGSGTTPRAANRLRRATRDSARVSPP